jgi:hypothetical protein
MLKFNFAFVIVFLLGSIGIHSAQAQSSTRIGAAFTIESNEYGTPIEPGVGIVVERKVTKRSGIETGLFYRNYVREGYFIVNSGSGSGAFNFTVAERHLSFPVLYKLHTGILNLSVGPSFEFFLGWNQRNASETVVVTSYSIDPVFAVGAMLKLSKNIRLSENFILEPEFRFNPILSTDRAFVGFGVVGKFQL